MKLALIPPFSWLATSEVTNYQLMLPHLMTDHDYAKHYRTLAKRKDQYIILDNGAAEGKDKFTSAQLVGMGVYAEVDEIVVPDVLRDQVETLNRMSQFFKDIHDLRNDAFGPDHVRKMKFMGVVQGQTYQEAKNCIDIMMELHGERLHSIALPRHLLETTGDHTIRLDLGNYIFEHYTGPQGGMQIHCLGSSHLWPKEMLELGKEGIFRGMDTSMPYNWAYQDTYLNEEYQGIKRPARYFSRPARDFNNNALHYNIGICKRWAIGDDRVSV